MAYMKDATGRRLDSFQVADLLELEGAQKIRAHFDASTLDGANGATIRVLPDIAGHGQDVFTSGTAPTLVAGGQNGLNVLSFGAAAYLSRTSFASAGTEWGQAALAPPLTYVMVARINGTTTDSLQVLISGTPAGQVALMAHSGHLRLTAGGAGTFRAGPYLRDDKFHVLVGVNGGARGASLYVDGYLVNTVGGSGFVGTNNLSGLGIFANSDGTQPLNGGRFAEAMVINEYLAPQQVARITATLAQKWGIS